MAATPADIARYSSDGALIVLKDEAIKDRDPNAQDTGDREVAMFFNDSDHGEILANELFAFVSLEGRPHEGVETNDSLGLGSSVFVFPRAPRAYIIDEERKIDQLAIVRQYSFDMGSDTYALELVGLRLTGNPPSFDQTDITLDNAVLSWDSDWTYSA